MKAAKITLETLFAMAATIGLLSAQQDEPDREWAADWAIEYGRIAARKARSRAKAARKPRQRR